MLKQLTAAALIAVFGGSVAVSSLSIANDATGDYHDQAKKKKKKASPPRGSGSGE